MSQRWLICALLVFFSCSHGMATDVADQRFPDPISLDVPHILSDRSVEYDFPIVYVRVPRKGDDVGSKWAEIAHPVLLDPGGDLMLLHPDGSDA